MLTFIGYFLATPFTMVGFFLLAYYQPTSVEWRDGCIEVVSSRSLIGGKWVGAQTFGFMIVYRDAEQQGRGDLAVHERVHVRQAMIGSVLFPIAYGAEFAYHYVAGPHHVRGDWVKAYYEISFERKAYARALGYSLGIDQESYWGHR